MELEKEEINYYEVIGCTIDSTNEQIGRAVRKLSVKYHPDKNKAPEAADIFLKIQKCKEFLLDVTKRKEYDEKYKAIAKRKEYDAKRYQNMDGRRKRMREELEERLGNAQKPASQRTGTAAESTSQAEKRRKKAELDRIRRDGLERVHAATSKQQQQRATSIDDIAKKMRAREVEQADLAAQAQANAAVEEEEETVFLQIKVKWKRSAESHSDDTLATLFRSFGPVEEVSILPGRGASAVVTFHFSAPAAAAAAVKAYEASSTLRVSIYGEPKKASIFTHVYSASTSSSFSTSASAAAAGNSAHFSNNSFVESDLMREVKRTMEREALLQQLHMEEEGGGNTTTTSSSSSSSSSSSVFSEKTGSRSASFTSTSTTSSSTSSSFASDIHSTSSATYIYAARDMPQSTRTGGTANTIETLVAKEKDVLSRMLQFSKNQKNSVSAH